MTLPDDATIRSIKINPVSKVACGMIAYGCGCRTTGFTWELCLYHEGFDIGVDTVRREEGRAGERDGQGVGVGDGRAAGSEPPGAGMAGAAMKGGSDG